VRQPSVRSLLVGAGFCLFILAPVLATAQSEKVKVGLLMINADAGIFVAQDKGFFRDQGLTVELTYFSSSGGAQMAALTTGELDAGSGSISPGIYNSVAGGVNMRVVATKSRVGPRGSGRYLVRRSLVEPGKTFALKDLKGKVIALNSVGGTSRRYLDGLLRKAGLKETDVIVRVMPFNDMVGALSQGTIDAGFFVRAADLWDLFPGHSTNSLFYSDAFMRNRPAVAEKFMAGFLKGQRYFTDAVVKQKESVDAVVDIVAKYSRTSDRKILRLGVNGTDLAPNGEVDLKELHDDQEWFFQRKLVKTKVDVNKLVELRFLQSAVQSLGSYR